jgi:hypothetical protein
MEYIFKIFLVIDGVALIDLHRDTLRQSICGLISSPYGDLKKTHQYKTINGISQQHDTA